MKRNAFTLIEILIVLVIIAVLSLIAFAVFGNVGSSANDSRKQADIQSLSKTYEVNYDPVAQTYQPLAGNQFRGGVIPTPPEGGSYTCVRGPDASCTTVDSKSFLICTTLKGGTPGCSETSPSCFCLASTQSSSGGVAVPYTSPSYSTPYITPAGPSPSPSPTPPPPPSCPTTGLVAYWKMDEASGTNVAPSVGSANGTAQSAVTVVVGRIGNGRGFGGGANNSITFSTLSNPSTNGPITLRFWIMPQNTTPIGIFDSAPSQGNVLRNYGSNRIEWHDNNPGITPLGLTANVWSQIVVVYHQTGTQRVVKYYKDNNAPITATAANSTTYTWSNFTLGTINGGGAGSYLGRIDEVGIWNRELDSAEVTALWNSGNGMSCP